ncbi:MAG: hypothetical protein V4515_11335 [Chloroflexota bacterium]
MILIERPCCDTPQTVDLPIPDQLRCLDCAVIWDVVDPAPVEARLAA